MRAIRINVNGGFETIELKSSNFTDLAAAIGGPCKYVECAPVMLDDHAVLVDEEGLFNGQIENAALIGGQIFPGAVLVVGVDDDAGEFIDASLTNAQIEELLGGPIGAAT